MTASVTWMLLDKLGGIYNFAANLLRYREPDDLEYAAVLARNLRDADDPSDADLSADVRRVSFSLPPENFHAVLRRLAASLPSGTGVIVANDWLSLAMASARQTRKSVVYINHGDFDYYYDLAVMHDPTIDRFLTYTERMRQRLLELLPHRAKDIFCIPYGVEIPNSPHRTSDGPIRLLYCGRLDPSKGVFDLPLIDRELRLRGHAVQWTIQGPGPAEADLKQRWGNAPHVRWQGRTSMEQVKQQYAESDILIMPSRAEGLPVALLEAMAGGCVPIVSDLESGIRTLIQNDITGIRVTPGDISGFAGAIASLSADRHRLAMMSHEASRRIAVEFNVARQAPKYQEVISPLVKSTPRWSRSHMFYGSKLDRPWIPNVLVTGARSLRAGIQQLRRPVG